MTGLYVFLGGLALVITAITWLDAWAQRHDQGQKGRR